MPDPIMTLSRCLHVLGAIALLGGALFIRFVLLPSASELPDHEQAQLKNSTTRRWKPFVHSGIALLLLTGFYNYIAVMAPLHQGDGRYHMLMGIKILLAMIAFFIVSVLPGRIPTFEKMRRNNKTWLMVAILCSTAVVVIAGVLKVRGVPVTAPATISQPEQTASTEPAATETVQP